MFKTVLIAIYFSALALASGISRRETTLITGFTESPIEWIYPAARAGFNASTANYPGCGNSPPSANRTRYPVSGGVMSFQSISVTADISVLYINEADPKEYHDFKSTSVQITDMSPGDFCVNAPDFSSDGYAAGTEVTLAVFYQLYGGLTFYYHCADLVLVEPSAYTKPDFICANTSTVLNLSGGTGSRAGQTVSIYGATVTATITSIVEKAKSGLTPAEGGGIGASLAIVVLVACLGAAYGMGLIRFARRSRRSPNIMLRDDSSQHSGIPLKPRE